MNVTYLSVISLMYFIIHVKFVHNYLLLLLLLWQVAT